VVGAMPYNFPKNIKVITVDKEEAGIWNWMWLARAHQWQNVTLLPLGHTPSPVSYISISCQFVPLNNISFISPPVNLVILFLGVQIFFLIHI
jgi:hypothetical protein